MGKDDLTSAGSRWQSRPLFRRERRRRRWPTLLLLLLGATGIWLALDPALIPSAKATLLQLLPPH